MSYLSSPKAPSVEFEKSLNKEMTIMYELTDLLKLLDAFSIRPIFCRNTSNINF